MEIVKGLLVVSFLYTLLLSIIYFSKSRLKNMENFIYKILLGSNLVGLILEFMCIYFAGQMTQIGDKIIESYHVTLIARMYLIYLLIWISTFISYIYSISFDEKRKVYKFINNHKKSFKFLAVSAFIAFVCFISFAPMYFYNDGVMGYTWGPAIDSLMLLFSFGVVFCLINVLLSFKRVKWKKYSPVFIFFLGVALVVILKAINPEIQVVGTTLAFVTVIMYFTIENPDLQMLFELKENRQLIEKGYESNANFIFNASQDIKNPVKNIQNIYDVLKSEQDLKILKDGLEAIKKNSDELNFIVSNFLDVSSLDVHNIKIVSNKYNLHNLLNAIVTRAKQEVKGDVELRLNIYANVPKILYGDEVKVKQILTTILMNSIKFTTEGFIELSCEAIVKYDACRLKFTIEDSGKGMDLNQVNNLMSFEGSLSDDEIALLDKVDLNIKVINKITKLIGGMLLIRSEEDKGSKFTIILEQKIADLTNNAKLTSAKFEKSYLNSRRVLLVSDVKEDLTMVKNFMSNYDVEVITTMYGKDCVDKIANKEKYDLILIEDEMRTSSALTTLQELQKIDNRIPVIVGIAENKTKLKKHYINEGFADVILKNKAKSELERIVNKYL